MKTCGSCAHLCDDFDPNGHLLFLCGAGRPYIPTIQKEDGKFDYTLTEAGYTLKYLRIMFYAEVHCLDWTTRKSTS